jgi:hypothetical protein
MTHSQVVWFLRARRSSEQAFPSLREAVIGAALMGPQAAVLDRPIASERRRRARLTT